MTTDDDNNTSSSSSSSHHHHHKEKWDSVFQSKDMKQVSWHRERLGMSWEMAESALETLSAGHGGSAAAASVRVLDVGAGASSLFAKQCLADARVGHVTVLDISEHALALHRTHLGTHWPPAVSSTYRAVWPTTRSTAYSGRPWLDGSTWCMTAPCSTS